MKRQAMVISIDELRKIADELEIEQKKLYKDLGVEYSNKGKSFQLNIINKTPECSDTWKFECIEEHCSFSEGTA